VWNDTAGSSIITIESNIAFEWQQIIAKNSSVICFLSNFISSVSSLAPILPIFLTGSDPCEVCYE
jgi:hypothetical protein